MRAPLGHGILASLLFLESGLPVLAANRIALDSGLTAIKLSIAFTLRLTNNTLGMLETVLDERDQ